MTSPLRIALAAGLAAALCAGFLLPSPGCKQRSAQAAGPSPGHGRGALPAVVVRVEYTPSALELLWGRNLGAWADDLCATLGTPAQAPSVAAVLSLLDSQDVDARTPAHAALTLRTANAGLLSRLERVYSDGSVERIFMEPLVGMLRDPRVSCPPGKRHFFGTGGKLVI